MKKSGRIRIFMLKLMIKIKKNKNFRKKDVIEKKVRFLFRIYA